MNFYFVFEGKTESIVYKEWLSVLLPQLSEVDSFDAVIENNYYYESNMGIPDCYNVVANAIQEINEFPKYDYLVLFIDADRFTIEEKKKEAFGTIFEKLMSSEKNYTYKELPHTCKLEVIVQRVCIETWFLGNRRFFVRNPQSELLRKYVEYFDVSSNDPEELASEFIQNNEGTNQIFGYSTKALFHEGYLREVFKERLKGISYQKSRPKEVQTPQYLEQIIVRTKDFSSHLSSFQEFVSFCEKLQF